MRPRRVESPEVERPQGLAVDEPAGLETARVQGPVRDLQAGVVHDVRGEHHRYRVEPPLISPRQVLRLEDAVEVEMVGPVFEKRTSLRTDGDEARVERAAPEQVEHTGRP